MSNDALAHHVYCYFQGQGLLWSTSEAERRLAIMETIERCSVHFVPPVAVAATTWAAATSSPHLQDADEDQRRLFSNADSLCGTFNKM